MPGELRIRRGRGLTRRLLDAAGSAFEAVSVMGRLSDAAISKHRLVKAGSDANHVNVCAAVDTPVGVCLTEAGGAETQVDIAFLPGNAAPVKMVASAPIAVGALLEPAASGKVQTLTGSIGTHHVVGRALEAAAGDLSVIQVIPMYFLRVI